MSLLPRRTHLRLVAQGAALSLVFGALPGASALADKGSLPASASQTAVQAITSNSAAKQSLEEVIPQRGNGSKSGPATLYKLNASGGGCGNNGHGNDGDGYDGSNPGKKPGRAINEDDEDGTPGNGKGYWDNHDKGGNCGVSKS